MKTIARTSLAAIGAATLSILLPDHGRANALQEFQEQPARSSRAASDDMLSAIPKGFIPNTDRLGDEEVRFLIRDHGICAYFTDRGFVLWNGGTRSDSSDGAESRVPIAPRWSLVGANPVEPVGGTTCGHTVSFFRGNDPEKWRANVPAHREITYPGILSGVDMRVESLARGFEYSFHVQPHAKPDLNFLYDGISGLELSPAGDLIVRTATGHFTESRPVSWQIIGGTKRPVRSAFELVSSSEYRIALGPYDERHELVIDPVLDWSTLLGGSSSVNLRNVKTDSAGNVCVSGTTTSLDLSDTAGFSTGPGVNYLNGWFQDVVVAKFNSSGTELLWLGYLAGAGASTDEVGFGNSLALLPVVQIQTVQIHIAFDAAMNASNDYWYLDDLRLTGTVEPVPPVAEAGPDLIASADSSGFATVELDGAGSFDPDGGGLVGYEWVEITPGGPIALGNAVSVSPSLAVGVHTITLTVTDDESDTASDTVQITVTPYVAEVEVFADSFEVGEWNGLWTEDSQNDWFRSSQRASAGAGSWSAEVDGSASNASLTSLQIDVPPGLSSATITFDWLIESGLDGGESIDFQVSLDGGAFTTPFGAILLGNTDPENQWHSETIAVTGLTSHLRLRFRGTMDKSDEDANVDNVRVVAHD